MKKYIIYAGILIIGMLIGSIAFGNYSGSETTQNHEINEEKNQKWTCSMHPQIMQNEPGDCPICGMDLIPAETSADGLNADEFKMSENALALANIQTSSVSSNNSGSTNLVLSGKIKANEKTNAIQTAHFGGRIEKLYVNSTGEEVNKGQLLATIYSPELVTSQRELLIALNTSTEDSNLYKAVRNKLKLWKLSDEQIAKIESSNEIITNFPIYANVKGVVTMKMIEEGNYVKEGQGLFMISNLNTVWADFDAYEKQIPIIKIGDEISIATNSNPNEKISAKITFIDPVLNEKTRTVIVRTELNNYNDRLKPGMFIQGVLKSSNSVNLNESKLMIPKTAVLWTGKRSVVYLRKNGAEPIFEMREITIGASYSDSYEILEGLSEGEEIVTMGTFTVDAAAQLQGKKSMMNPNGGKVQTGHDHGTGAMEDETQSTIEIKRVDVADEFKVQLNAVFQMYNDVKNSLVSDNSNEAQVGAELLLGELKKVNMSLLVDENSHNSWMAIQKKMLELGESISSSDNIENQRESFIGLSTNMIHAVEMFGITQKVYKQFCPMANNDKGAFWLSKKENIENPYYGEMMLTCGNVESIIEY